MNERLKFLSFALKAVPEPSVFKVEHFQGDVGYWSSTHPVWQSELYQKDKEHFTCVPLYTPEDLEKFAELIVQECLKMCKTAVGNQDYNTGRMHCYDNIKEHFGVEE